MEGGVAPNTILRSEATAWLLGAAALGGLGALAYWQVGWLGIGLLGLVGLVVSTRIDLHGGLAVTESGAGSGDVPMYAKQLEVRKSESSPEQKMAAAAEQAERARVLYLINTVFIGMTALGFGLFVLHQV
jgi:hypothetical protein